MANKRNSTTQQRKGTLPKPTPAASPSPSSTEQFQATETAKKPTAATTAATPAKKPTDPYTQSIKEFDKIKPTSDIYVQPAYQGFNIMVAPSVKSEFFEVIAAGAERAGLQYSRWNRQITVSGLSPNYNMDAMLKAIQNIAGYYNLKMEVANTAVPTVEPYDLQRRIEGLVASLLPSIPSEPSA